MTDGYLYAAQTDTGWKLLPTGLILGSLGALAVTSIPPSWLLCSLAIAGILLLWPPPLRWVGGMLLAFSWTLWNFQVRLDDRLDPTLSGQSMTVSGVISSMPQVFGDQVSFRFEPLADGAQGEDEQPLPRSLLVRWYE